MKRTWRFILPLILLCSLAIPWVGAECLVTGELNNEQYGYSEKVIPTDCDGKNVTMMKVNHHNQLVFLTYAAGTVRFMTLDTTGKLLSSFYAINGVFTLDSRDNVYILDEQLQRVCVYNSKGTLVNTIKSDQIPNSPGEPRIEDLALDSKGNVYGIVPRKSVIAIYQNGRRGKVLKTGQYWSMDITPEGALLLGGYDPQTGKSFLELFNPASGRSLWKTDLEIGELPRFVKYCPANRMIYLTSEKGVKKYSEQGHLIEVALDFKQTHLLEDNYHIWSMAVMPDETLYFSVATTRSSQLFNSRLYQYKLTAAPKTPSKTLTLNVGSSDQFLESAIAKFQRLHPEIRIQVRDFKAAWYSNNDNGLSQAEDTRARQAVENYISTNQAELMAGKGADLINVSGLPYWKYISKGFLMNLDEISAKDPDFDLQSLNPNLITACKYQNTLYTMPIFYYAKLLGANPKLLPNHIKIDDQTWTWDDFLKIATAVTKETNHDGAPERYALPKMKPQELFSLLLNYQYDQFVDFQKKTASFNSAPFIRLLKILKEMDDRKIMSPKLDIAELWKMTDPGTIAFIPAFIAGFDSLIYHQAIFNGQFDLLRYPESLPEEYQFQPTLFAINKNTHYPREAWEFIKFLLSQEVQSLSNLYYFPVNTAALKARAETMLKESWRSNYYRTDKGREVKNLTPDDIQWVYGIINRLNHVAIYDNQIQKILENEIPVYLQGNATAEAAAKAIQSQVTAYLKE